MASTTACDDAMWEAILWGALLRFARATIQSAPTILVGLFVAGIFRRLLGQSGTRRLLGCGTWRRC
jgi:ABC-type phosphate transport system permease subunit